MVGQTSEPVAEPALGYRRARDAALKIVASQFGITALATLVGYVMGGQQTAASAFVGGAIGTLASLYMVFAFFRLGANAEPEKILGRVYRGEVMKLLLTGLLFAIALATLELEFGPLLAAYCATFVAYWTALVTGLNSEHVPQDKS